MSEEMQKQTADPEIDQAEIDREIAELLGESSKSDDSDESQDSVQASKQPASAPAPAAAEKPKPELKASPTMPSSFRLNMPSAGDSAPPPSDASYFRRHPFLTMITILGFIAGIITIFAVSLKVGLLVIGGAVAFHILGLLLLAFKRHPILMTLAVIALAIAAYFAIPVSRCCDGTWSFSEGSGTCSHHGGMSKNGCDLDK